MMVPDAFTPIDTSQLSRFDRLVLDAVQRRPLSSAVEVRDYVHKRTWFAGDIIGLHRVQGALDRLRAQGMVWARWARDDANPNHDTVFCYRLYTAMTKD
jgi:hypothetical protein